MGIYFGDQLQSGGLGGQADDGLRACLESYLPDRFCPVPAANDSGLLAVGTATPRRPSAFSPGTGPERSQKADIKQALRIVIRRDAVPAFVSAVGAAVQDGRLAVSDLQSDRLHQSAAVGHSVAGIYVHMPTPEAARAVVGVAVAAHEDPATGAGEVLLGSLKLFGQHGCWARLCRWGPSAICIPEPVGGYGGPGGKISDGPLG